MARKDFGAGQVGPVTRLLAYILMVCFTALTILPLVWLFYSSFKLNPEIIRYPLGFPKHWTIQNYVRAWTVGHLGVYFINTIFYTGVATFLTTLLALMTGYGFAKFGMRITPLLSWFIMLGLLITVQAVLVPLYMLWTKIGLYDTRLGVILPYIAFGLPMAIYLATAFIKGIPDSLIEAGIIDGASYLSIFRRVIVPVSQPVVATITILTFLGNWNEFVFAFMLVKRDELRSLSVGINSFAGTLNFNYGLQFAALVIGIVPMILFYILFHHQLKIGFAEGALKD